MNEKEDTKKQLIHGMAWTAVAKYSGVFVQIAVTCILARLLVPEDFGVVTIANVILSFFSVFASIGIFEAVIQKKELTHEDHCTLFTVSVGIGTFFMLLCFFLAWPIARFYHNDLLRPLCQILSVQILLSSASVVPDALFARDKRFKYVSMRTLIIQVTSGIISVAAAFMGAGVYTLLINPLFSAAALLAVSLKEYPMSLRFKGFKRVYDLVFTYSLYRFLFDIINSISSSLDKLIVGKKLDMESLGFYEKSYRLMLMPVQNIANVISPVMHPVLSDFRNDRPTLARHNEKIVHILALIGFPMSVLLFFASRETILLFYGHQWYEAIPIFQIFTAIIGFRVVITSSGSIFQSADDTRSMFICGVFTLFANTTAIVTGVLLYKSITVLAIAMCCAILACFIQCYTRMYLKTLKQSLLGFLKQFTTPFLCSAISFAVLWPVSKMLDGANIIVSLIVKCVVWGIVFVLFVQLSKEFDIIHWTKKEFRKRILKKPVE